MSSKNKQSLAGLFSTGGKLIGLDDEASSTLIANLNATTMPMCVGSPFDADEQECDDFRLLEFVLDRSGSMEDVAQEVINCFNEIIMPGLLGGAVKQVGAIRYGGLTFDSVNTPLWGGGFQKLTTQFPKLTSAEYSARGATGLNKGVLDGVTALTNHALQIADTTGTMPECVLVVLSDGANNLVPHDPKVVRDVLEKLSPELFTLVFIGFETYEKVDFKVVAKDLGFRDVIDSKKKPGEDADGQRKRFRNLMKVFSEKLVSRTSQSRVGTSVPQTGSSNFWE